jgi:hypothetical protein
MHELSAELGDSISRIRVRPDRLIRRASNFPIYGNAARKEQPIAANLIRVRTDISRTRQIRIKIFSKLMPRLSMNRREIENPVRGASTDLICDWSPDITMCE